MAPLALVLALPIAVAAILAIVTLERGRRRAHYVLKPATMTLVIAIPVAKLVAGGGLDAYGYLVLAGLLCSVVGDVLLMLERNLFVAGLASFLVAHVFYVAAFGMAIAATPGGPVVERPMFWLPLAVLLAFAFVMVRALAPGLGSLVLPVAAYITVISVMGWFALALGLMEPATRSGLAAIGAVLFMASDSVLALDRFRTPLRWAQPALLATYFAAQWCFAASM